MSVLESIDQEVVDLCHRRHRQQTHVSVTGDFVCCCCGLMFDDGEAATGHFWRALKALQRVHTKNGKRGGNKHLHAA